MSPSSVPPAPLPGRPTDVATARPAGREVFERSVLDALSAAVTVVDGAGRVLSMNDTWRRDDTATDLAETDADRTVLTYEALCRRQVAPQQAHRLTGIVDQVLRGDTDRAEEDVDVSTVGRARWLHVEAVAHTDATGRRNALVTHTDITRHRQNEAHLAWLADHDQLTGLANRRRLARELSEHLAGCGPSRPVGVVLVGVTGFSRVEDAVGQVLGDGLIVEVALRLATTLGDRGLTVALGGDQFALVVPGTNRHELDDLTARIGAELARPLRAQGVSGLVTATQGVTLVTDPTLSAGEALRDADTAMLQARSGAGTSSGDPVAFFDETMRTRLQHRSDLEAGLRGAVARNELHLAFQPIVELSTGRVVSAEALLRWIRPRRGLVPPDRFIPVAEEAGLMGRIGSWVLRRAVAQAAEWSAAGHDVPVSVNVSVQQLVPGFADEVRAVLEAHALPPSLLVIEITESVVMADLEIALTALTALRRLGCRIAMDDFGTGQSSLINLKRLPIHVVKLDKAFVAGVADEHSADGSIVAAMLGLTDALGLMVVVEGIETPEQVTHLERLGCTFGQGFLYSPPRDPAAMTAYLAETAARNGVHPTVAALRSVAAPMTAPPVGQSSGPQPSRTLRSAAERPSPVSGFGTNAVSSSSGRPSGGA